MTFILGEAEEVLKGIEKESIHLCVTSPPYYNARTEYAEYDSVEDYLDVLSSVFCALSNTLVDGARVCVNIANYGRNPYIPLSSYLNQSMLDNGYMMRGEIVWNKGAGAGGSTSWGSWRSVSNPTLRDVHEMILVYQWGKSRLDGDKGLSEVDRDDFLVSTKSVWDIRPESAKKIGHPAPFPIEIPRRLISLYSYAGNMVIDPFAGSCTTGVAAHRLGREFICIDRMQEYLDIGLKRLEE